METQNFMRIVWRWLWLLLLGVAVGVGTSYYALRALGHVPVYEATATVGIGTQLLGADQNLENLQLGRELAPTYVELVTMRPMTQAVIDELQLSLTPQELAGQLRVDILPDSPYLHITAVAHTSQQAADIANATARQLALQTPPRLRGLFQIVEPATPPAAPSLRPFIAVFIAGLVGLFLALGIAALIERLDDTLKRPEQVTRHLGLTVFGVIRPTRPRWKRLLRRSAPTPGPALTRQPVWWTAIEGCRHVWNGASPGAGQPTGKRVLVTSPGRAEGKTTAAIGLAAAWARTGLNVALLEAHLDRPALGRRLGLSAAADLAAWSEDGIPALQEVMIGRSTKLRVLAAGHAAPDPLDLISAPPFQRLLEEIDRQADLVVIDAPPLLSNAEAPLLAGKADGVLLVVRARKTRLGALKEAVEILNLVGSPVLGVIFDTGQE